MNFLNKMQRKFGRYAIKNLSLYVIALFAAGYIMQIFSPTVLGYMTLEPAYILRGQVWRLVTWLLVPPSSFGLFTVIMLYFYYSVGNALERKWGSFRYNVYIFSGIFAMIIGAFVLEGILTAMLGHQVLFGELFTTYYINTSIFLAFAATYPETSVYLYFLIPIKMKWLGIFYGATLLLTFFSSNWIVKVMMVISMLNFIVYFIGSRSGNRYGKTHKKIIYDFERAKSTRERNQAEETTRTRNHVITRHKCAVCGKTELDDDMMEFRFCSKCDGNYEYCKDHIFTHEHVKRS